MPPPVIAIEINSVKAKRDIKSIRSSLGDLRKRVNELGRSVKKVNFADMKAGKVTPDLKNMRSALNKNTVALNKFRGGLKRTGKQATKTSKQLKGTKARVTELSKSIQIALGPLSGIAARLTAFSGLATGAGIAIAAIVAGTIALAAAFLKTVSAGKEMEERLLQIQQLITVTGGVAGRSAQEVDNLAQSIANSTLASVNDIRDAGAVLLTFVAVTGKAFDRTLKISQDLAQLGFGSARNAAVQLGKALEDPTIGLTALRRVGVSFTKELREQIIELSKLGQTAEAVELILGNLESQVGGVAEAAGTGLSGSIDRLGDNLTKLFEVIAEQGKVIPVVKFIFDDLNKSIERFTNLISSKTIAELVSDVEEAQAALASRGESTPVGGFNFLDELASNVEKFIAKQTGIEDALIRPKLIRDLTEAFEKLGDALNAVDEAAEGTRLRAGLLELSDAERDADRLATTFEKLEDRVIRGAKAQRDFDFAMKTVNRVLETQGIGVDSLIKSDEQLLRLKEAIKVAFDNAAGSARFLDKAQRELNKQAAAANRILKRLIETRNRAFAATEQQVEAILAEAQALLISGKERKVELELLKARNRLIKAGIELRSLEARTLLAAVREAAELREEVRAAVKDETEALKDFTKVIGTAFEDALVKGANFRDLLKSIEEDLIRIVTRVAITKPFESALTTAIEGGKLDKDAEGIEKLGFSLGSFLKDIFGFGNQKKQEELAKTVGDAQAKAAAASGQFAIDTGLASTAVQDLAKAAVQASIALRQIQLVQPGGGIGGLLGSSGAGGGAIGLGSTGLDFQGFGGTVGGFLGPFGKGGVAGPRGRVNVHNFDSGGVASSPSVAVFAEGRSQKEAFVPLPNSGKIPVELGGDVGGGITINGPLMVVETRDLESFEQSDTQVAANILGILQRSQRNT